MVLSHAATHCGLQAKSGTNDIQDILRGKTELILERVRDSDDLPDRKLLTDAIGQKETLACVEPACGIFQLDVLEKVLWAETNDDLRPKILNRHDDLPTNARPIPLPSVPALRATLEEVVL